MKISTLLSPAAGRVLPLLSLVRASLVIALAAMSAPAANLVVPGNANIFGAGHVTAPNPGVAGGGQLPPVYRFAPAPNMVLTFSSVTGTVRIDNDDRPYYANAADGGGYTTSLLLLNTANRTEKGTLQILDNNGSPLVVSQVGGTADSSFRYSIPPGGAFRFQTDGFLASIKAGWVRLIPDLFNPRPIGSGVFSYSSNGILVSESGIPATTPTNHARIYVDLTENHNTGWPVRILNPRLPAS